MRAKSALAAVAAATALLVPTAAQAAVVTPRHYAERMAQYGFSGAIQLTNGGRVVLSEGYGEANRATSLANDPDLGYPMASVSKPITAITILSLIEDRVLALDATIDTYLSGVPRDKASLTIGDLLLHHSGLPGFLGPYGDEADISRAEAIDIIMELPLEAPYGEYSYSDPGYILLAAIAEEVTRTPWTTLVRDRIFTPADMDTSGFWGDLQYTVLNSVHAYRGDVDEDAVALRQPPTFAILGAGGVISSATDMAKLADALDDGLILDATRMRLLLDPVALENDPSDPSRQNSYGFSTTLTPTRNLEVDHDGTETSDGASAMFYWAPTDGVVAVTTSNDDRFNARQMSNGITAAAFGQDVPLPPATTAYTSAHDALLGAWSTSPDGQIEVERAGDRLLASASKQPAIEALYSPSTALATELSTQDAEAYAMFDAMTRGLTSANGNPLPPGMRPGGRVSNWYQSYVTALGSLTSLTSLGTQPRSFDLASRVKFTFARGVAYATMLWLGPPGDHSEFGFVELDSLPIKLEFMPISRGRAAHYAPLTKQTTKIKVDARGRLRLNADGVVHHATR